MKTEEQIRLAVIEDFGRHLGRVLLVGTIDGYSGEDSVTVALDEPLRVRVIATNESDLVRAMGEGWYDPCWEVEPLEERSELAGLRNCWVYGHSHNVDGREERGPWVLAEAA